MPKIAAKKSLADLEGKCMFLCGSIKDKTSCPVKPATDAKIAWSDRLKEADFYCFRVFRCKYEHMIGAWALREKMIADKDELDRFLDQREKFVSRQKSGFKGFGSDQNRKDRGVKRTICKKKRYSEELLPPPMDALPWEEYKELYSEKTMRKAGHYKKRVNGKSMVIMGKEKGATWKLQQKYAKDIEEEEKIVLESFSRIFNHLCECVWQAFSECICG